MHAMTFIGLVQRGQTRTSVANTRFSSEAQSRRYIDFGVVGVGGDVGGWGTTSARRRLVGAAGFGRFSGQ
jgi:hypothetical protein